MVMCLMEEAVYTANDPGPVSIQDRLAQHDTLYDSLHELNAFLKPFGVGQLVYGFMLHRKSHLRQNDNILYATFERSIRDIGMKDGGALTYRFADVTPRADAPLFFDLEETLHGKGPLYSHNNSYRAIYNAGYRHAWVIPFSGVDENGFGLMIMFQNMSPNSQTINIDELKLYAPLFHREMIGHKKLANHFKLSRKQIEALSWVSKGRTASYLAEKLGISERSIELRLQEARKKLCSLTTAEAVYKALAYGILPFKD